MFRPKDFFLSVTERIFSNWTALKIAVEHGMGTKEKAQDFCPYVTDLIYMNDQLNPSDVAAELEDYMDLEFATELEDNSAIQVAQELLRFYQFCVSGDETTAFAEYEKLPPLQPWIANKLDSTESRPLQSSSQENDSSISSKNEGTSNDEMEVEDTWTTVKTRRKK